MTWVAAAIIGSAGLSYLGGQKQAGAAEDAAKIQAAAAREQLAFQKEVFERLQQQQTPYRQAGYTALNQINALLGLPPAYTTQEEIPRVMPTQRPQVGPTGMPLPMVDERPRQYRGPINPMPVKPGMRPQFTASGLQARDLAPGGKQLPMMDQRPRGRLTPEQAAQAQAGGMQGRGWGSFGNKPLGAATLGALGENPSMIDPVTAGLAGQAAGDKDIRRQALTGLGLGVVDPLTGGLAGSALSKVFGRGGGSLFGGMSDAIRRAAGQVMNAPGGEGDGGGYPLQGPTVAPGYQVGEGMMGFGSFARPFGPQDLMTNLAPNYQFMKEQGLGAVMQGANVGGGGSNVQRGAIKFAEDYARNAYQDALNNYRLQQGDIFNRLTNLTGTGQTAQQNIGQTAGQLGSNISQLGIGAAQAQAAGQIGSANAMAGSLGNIGGLLGTYGLLKAFPQS
jgi:hypothetical protein